MRSLPTVLARVFLRGLTRLAGGAVVALLAGSLTVDTASADSIPASASPAALASDPAHALARYVQAGDDSYSWRKVGGGRIGDAEYAELALTSQTWHGIPWKHQLLVIRPAHVDAVAAQQGFFFIDGGSWNPAYEAGYRGPLPGVARVFAALAESIHAPVAILRQVPFQPLFDGRKEDALIAFTFANFMHSGEGDWPLLLPMVKSAARGMDAVQQFAKQAWQLPIERFTVAGASKRGWTAWLTAAVDGRVASVAPMVIDMLNLPRQIALQEHTFGGLSEQVRDYSDLPRHIDTERGQALLQMVDPWRYRQALSQPKLILLGTNDPYWPLDALHVYWNDLQGPKRVLYLPNQPHGLSDYPRLIASLSALHRYSVRGEPLPEVTWTFSRSPAGMALEVRPGRVAQKVTAWSARADTRDFRRSRWSSNECERAAGGRLCAASRSGTTATPHCTPKCRSPMPTRRRSRCRPRCASRRAAIRVPRPTGAMRPQWTPARANSPHRAPASRLRANPAQCSVARGEVCSR